MYEEFKWYTPGVNGFVDVEDVAAAVCVSDGKWYQRRTVYHQR